MGIEVWISGHEDGSYIMWDYKPHYLDHYGPVELSNELYERIRECEREWDACQGILETLVYDWNYPDE